MMGIQKEVKSIGAKRKPIVIKGGIKKAETNGSSSSSSAANDDKKTEEKTEEKTEVKTEVKMEVDAPVVKEEDSETKEETLETKPASEEKGENGTVKPLMDIKRNKKVVTIISGVAVKKADAKKKGMLMEQNQDALEYSSEEEDASKWLAHNMKKAGHILLMAELIGPVTCIITHAHLHLNDSVVYTCTSFGLSFVYPA